MWMYCADLRVRLATIFIAISAVVIVMKTATADHDRDDDSEYLSSSEDTAEIGNIEDTVKNVKLEVNVDYFASVRFGS